MRTFLNNDAHPNVHVALVLVLLIYGVVFAVEPAGSAFVGAWAFQLPDGNPAWLKIRNTDDQLTGSLLWSVGSARPVKDLRLDDGQITFSREISWRPYGRSIVKRITSPFAGRIENGRLQLSFRQIERGNKLASTEFVRLVGQPIPAPPPRPDLTAVRFGKAIRLFNGRDLDGWILSSTDKQNGWQVENGELVNVTPKTDFGAYGAYGNLITEQEFEDFRLTIQYNVPVGGNSGIYLRGIYEAQVVDRDSPMQGIQGPGAIFGRIAPNQNAGKPGGRWNTYVLTLVDRHVTVELNGKTVIENQLLEGCTGGGLQANDMLPGPILLQGDHTSVRYRNIEIRPVVSSDR